MTMARYRISAPAFVKVHPDDRFAKTIGEDATPRNPVEVEIDASLAPSRKWVPVNTAGVAARAALARADAANPLRRGKV